MKPPRSSNKLAHWTTVGVLALATALTVEVLFTIEWALPNCSDAWNGASPAIFGMPIPYERWAGASLEYEFLPQVYLLNVVLLFGAALPLAHAFVVRLRGRWAHPVRLLCLLLGALLCFGVLGTRASGLGFLRHPVRSIVQSQGESWRDLRPIRATMERRYHCQPSSLSRFWFSR